MNKSIVFAVYVYFRPLFLGLCISSLWSSESSFWTSLRSANAKASLEFGYLKQCGFWIKSSFLFTSNEHCTCLVSIAYRRCWPGKESKNWIRLRRKSCILESLKTFNCRSESQTLWCKQAAVCRASKLRQNSNKKRKMNFQVWICLCESPDHGLPSGGRTPKESVPGAYQERSK